MFGWLVKIKAWWRGGTSPIQPDAERQDRNLAVSKAPRRFEEIVLTDGVARTLFDDYAEHQQSERGDEEIGWILLGLREEGKVIALAALPAGTQRDAGAAHIRFNSDAQALASRIVRQWDKRLQMIGVVHTHPGSLRTPSGGDFAGDSAWVGQLRGGEGVFGIGTADARPDELTCESMQIQGGLCFHWYALAAGDERYHPLPVKTTIGPDLALPLRPIWSVLEAYADPLNKLCRQFARVAFELIDEGPEMILCMKIGLAEPNQQLRVLFHEAQARYYWDRNGELIVIDPREEQIDRAVYLILAELAKESAGSCLQAATVEA